MTPDYSLPHEGWTPSTGIRRWVLTLIGLVAAIALLVLLGGWVLELERMVRLRSEYAGMVPTTAINFLILCLALLWWCGGRDGPAASFALMMVSIAVAAIACINVLITVWSGVPGLDGTLWPARVKSDAMAYGTSACFLLAAVCSFSLSRRRALSDQTFVRVATIGLLTASVAFVGYAFDADALYGVFLFTTMAPHTAVAFVLLYTALLLTGRHVGWVGVLTAEGRGSAGARRLLPVAIGGPLLLCLLTNAATRAEWFSANFRLSLLAIMMMVLAAYAVLRNARMENQRSTSSARPWAS